MCSIQSFFANRILSRDECIDPFHKSGNLQHLFPCGDSMCAIIDDRGDVWKYSPNCILVKKYHFFADTGDINDPHAFKQTGKIANADKKVPQVTLISCPNLENLQLYGKSYPTLKKFFEYIV